MDELVESFFEKEYEEVINEKMFDYDYSFPEEEVGQYVLSLITIPYSQFINYISTRYCSKAIIPSEIPQISNYELSTLGVCKVLDNLNDPGLECTFIGMQLFTDGQDRKEGAYFKFGENHVKGASFHGLTHCCGNKWFLTCLGRIYPQLDDEMRQYLSARTLLRNPFFHIVIAEAFKHDVNIRFFMPKLSESTQNRRSSSCMHFLNVIVEQCRLENVPLHKIFYMSDNQEKRMWTIVDDIKKSLMFKSFLPVYSIRAACGTFNHGDSNTLEGWLDVVKFGFTPKEGLYIVHAEGNSMEPMIHDGDLCIFQYTNAVEEGTIMLVESNKDECRHVIKSIRYTDNIKRDIIVLHSLNSEYEDILLSEEDNPRIAGKLVHVLGKYKG